MCVLVKAGFRLKGEVKVEQKDKKVQCRSLNLWWYRKKKQQLSNGAVNATV